MIAKTTAHTECGWNATMRSFGILSLLVQIALLCCVAQGQREQVATTTAPRRSYAQAAQKPDEPQQGNNNNPSQSENTATSHVPTANSSDQSQSTAPAQNPTPPSYAQAANSGGRRPATARPGAPTPYPRPAQSYPGRTTVAPITHSITDDELRAFSEELLRNDVNNAGSSVRANFQARTYGSNVADLAPSPLLTIPARTLQGPTVSKLRALFDNYEADSSIAEVESPVEKNENNALLDAIVATSIMTTTRRFLIEKSLLSNEQGALRTLLQQIWFTMFPRGGGRTQIGSSSFEHIFLGEIHRGEISGLHNWVYFAAEESSGRLNYRGYVRRVDLGGKGSVIKQSFQWGNHTKPVGSMFIGTSPELDMALYTVCFLARPGERCPVKLSGQPFYIRTYPFTYHGKQYIGSAYPDI